MDTGTEPRIILTMPIQRTSDYGPQQAFLEISLLMSQVRRRLLKCNDEHGNKVMRKEILDGFGEIDRFASAKLARAGIAFNASDDDSEHSGRPT